MSDPGDMIVRGPGSKLTRPTTDVFVEPTAKDKRRRERGDNDGDDFELPFDPRRILAILKKRWLLFVKVGVVCGFLLSVLGYWRLNYHVSVVLISRDTGGAFVQGTDGTSYKPKQHSASDFTTLIQTPMVMRQVAYNAHPPISEKELRARVTVSQDRGTEDLLMMTVSGKNRQSLVEIANLYASNAVEVTKQIQLQDAHEMNDFYQKKIIEYDNQLRDINQEIVNFLAASGLSDPENEALMYMSEMGALQTKIDDLRIQAKLNALEEVTVSGAMGQENFSTAQRLQEAYQNLAVLRAKYTDQHPDVIKQLAIIEELKRLSAPTNTITPAQLASANDPSSPLYVHRIDLKTKSVTYTKQLEEMENQRTNLQQKIADLTVNKTRYSMINSRLQELMQARKMLADRQHEAQLYEDNAEGYYRVFAPATLNDVDRKARLLKSIFFGIAGFILGALGAAGFVIVGEIFDDRLKTVADVERVTKLPVLVTLGDLNKMSEAQKEEWAFHAWTALSGQLTVSPNHGMVCGFISSVHGEGRSTWVNMLVNAASQRGLRVLTVATRSSAQPGDLFHAEASAKADERAFENAVAAAMAAQRAENPDANKNVDTHSLIFPAEISQKLTSPNSPPVAHIALPGWVWNLERRKQWQSALTQWRQVDNLVLLVELPPASMPEAILLAENLPQLVWLVDSGKAHAKETRKQLQTLRHAKCRLVGAVLNHEPVPVFEL